MGTYFSIVFKTIRKQSGYTVNDFAYLLEIDSAELMLIENYELFPDSDTLLRLDKLSSNQRSILDFLN